ncbi:MAG: PAS domain S-box protein, partial [Promethearchaeia archaeon]
MSDNYKRNGSNSLYKEIVENISDLIVVLNLNYKINYINQPITKKLLGYKKNEIIGTSLMQYIHPDNRNNIEELKKNLGKKEKKRVTVRIKHREGHWIWFEIIGNSLRINENKKNIIFIGRIVTKRKNLKDLYKWLGELLRIERDLSVNLNKAENLKEGLDLCLHAALRVSKMDCGIIYLKKENSNQMEIFTHHNIPEEKLHLLSDFRQFDLDQINCSIYTQYSELEKNIERIHKNEGLKAVGIIPIYHRKRKIGILFVASRTLNQFPKSSREGLEIISSHIESSIIDTKRREKIKQNQKKLKESEERLKILNDTYLKFGKDPIQNIQHLVNAVGRILDADCALYNRIIKRKDKKVLKTLAIYNAPPNYKSEDDPIGHICYDLIESNTDDVVIIKNLDETKYAKTDINVINYDLKMYCGSGVKLNQDTVAMFCVVYTNNKPLKEADINLIRILAESASIEEQRMDAKRKLKESEEKYRLLFETMAQGVVYQEKSGRISTVNPAAKKILGLSDEMIKGRKSDHSEWKVIRADGSKFPGKYHPSMRALKTGKRNKNTIMGIFNPEREEYRWINVNAVPLFREEQKEPYRVYTTFEDITERKIAEEKLKEAVNRSDFYRDLLAHDMGNVLGNINSSLEILEMIGKGAKISQNKEDIMEIIRQAITRGKNL